MENNARTQGSPGGATIISRRRFLKQTALATAVVSVPYLAGKTVAFGKESAERVLTLRWIERSRNWSPWKAGRQASSPSCSAAKQRKVHTFGVRNIKGGLPIRVDDRMRIASVAKAFSGAVALSLVSKGALSLNDTIGELLQTCQSRLPTLGLTVTLRQLLNHTSGLPDILEDPDFPKAFMASPTKAPPPEKLLTYLYNNAALALRSWFEVPIFQLG